MSEPSRQEVEKALALLASTGYGNHGRFAPIVAAARAYVNQEITDNMEWWCVPFRLGLGVDEPCVAGSTHDSPYECHWAALTRRDE